MPATAAKSPNSKQVYIYIMKLWVWYVTSNELQTITWHDITSHEITWHETRHEVTSFHFTPQPFTLLHLTPPRKQPHSSCHVASMTSYHITSQHITWPPPTHHKGTTTHHQNTTTRPNGCRVPGRFFFPLKLPTIHKYTYNILNVQIHSYKYINMPSMIWACAKVIRIQKKDFRWWRRQDKNKP